MARAVHHALLRLLALALCYIAVAGCSTTAAQHTEARFDRATLDSIVAPIALYPDSLLSHVLMAATYPREVEEAARWSRERPGLSGDAAVRISAGFDFDPSVRSLLAFPLVLDTMARHMRWTEDLGAAFLAQRDDVMDAVQRLRLQAQDAGHLRSNDHVRVYDTGHGIAIESVSSQTVYVPHYDSRVVYGAWRGPATPIYWSRWPLYYDPPGRPYIVHWGPGIAIAPGFFFGGFYWPRREVRVVNVHSYYYTRKVIIERPVIVERPVEVKRPVHAHATSVRDTQPEVWRHDAARRHRLSAAHSAAQRAAPIEQHERRVERPRDRDSAERVHPRTQAQPMQPAVTPPAAPPRIETRETRDATRGAETRNIDERRTRERRTQERAQANAANDSTIRTPALSGQGSNAGAAVRITRPRERDRD